MSNTQMHRKRDDKKERKRSFVDSKYNNRNKNVRLDKIKTRKEFQTQWKLEPP